ncbi:ribosomal protein S18 acetylase RimI-like enzyme [Arthrobacter sp. CAN_A214]|uniref:GNAT family N-acetyltransferase n=1 Tax=Arthrobacter sp. CAN_A214 TaxID=2787720 RepID=UPI0018C8F38C
MTFVTGTPGTGQQTICEATPNDAVALAECAAVTFPLACPPDSRPADIEHFLANHLSAERFIEYLEDPDRTVLCIRETGVPEGSPDGYGRLGGYSMLVRTQPTDPDVLAALTLSPVMELSKFYVHPDNHGRGAAGALMRETLAHASRSGFPGIWLGVNQENHRAIRFYDRCGFGRVGVKRFQLGDRFEDDFILERSLPAAGSGSVG